MGIRPRITGTGVSPRSRAFCVEGSPVSVNRYGTPAYRNWRAKVFLASVLGSTWTASLFTGSCSVRIRYFRNKDRAKDVDNILKAILDGLDGKVGGHGKGSPRVIHDDRLVERVTSQRTDLVIHKAIDARSCHRQELAALILARRGQAAIFVSVERGPNQLQAIAP